LRKNIGVPHIGLAYTASIDLNYFQCQLLVSLRLHVKNLFL